MSFPRIVVSPGPVHVSPEQWAAIEQMHHRSDAFREIVRDTERMLGELLGTTAPVYTITSSGTGGMEFAVANVTAPGARVLVVSGGKFGDRWGELCKAYGCEIEVLAFPEGRAVDIERVIERVSAFAPDAIALTHVESSTGALLPLEELLAALPEERPLVLCDAIASAGVEAIEMDRWGIDVLVAASQKAFAAPPGVSFVCVGERAAAAGGAGRYYFSIDRYERGREAGDTPFTPSIPIIQIVHRSLSRMAEIGWEAVRERHRNASDAFTEAMRRLSFELLAENPSTAVQAFIIPDSYRGPDLVRELADQDGVIVGGGQGTLDGRIIRTGFLGIHGEKALYRVITAIERALRAAHCPHDREAATDSLARISDQGELFS